MVSVVVSSATAASRDEQRARKKSNPVETHVPEGLQSRPKVLWFCSASGESPGSIVNLFTMAEKCRGSSEGELYQNARWTGLLDPRGRGEPGLCRRPVDADGPASLGCPSDETSARTTTPIISTASRVAADWLFGSAKAFRSFRSPSASARPRRAVSFFPPSHASNCPPKQGAPL